MYIFYMDLLFSYIFLCVFLKLTYLFRPVPTAEVKRILLVTTYRTGSTFVGELLSSTPGSFFSFEPLSVLEDVEDFQKQPPDQAQALDLLKKVFTCDMPETFVKEAIDHPVSLQLLNIVYDLTSSPLMEVNMAGKGGHG